MFTFTKGESQARARLQGIGVVVDRARTGMLVLRQTAEGARERKLKGNCSASGGWVVAG